MCAFLRISRMINWPQFCGRSAWTNYCGMNSLFRESAVLSRWVNWSCLPCAGDCACRPSPMTRRPVLSAASSCFQPGMLRANSAFCWKRSNHRQWYCSMGYTFPKQQQPGCAASAACVSLPTNQVSNPSAVILWKEMSPVIPSPSPRWT